MVGSVKTRIAQGLFSFVAQSDAVSDLVSEVNSLKRSMIVLTAVSLVLPFSSIALLQKFGIKHPAIVLGTNAAAVVAAQAGHKRRKAIGPKSELLKTESKAKQERAQKQIINEQFPETVEPPIVSGIGGKVQIALATQGIKCFVSNVVDAPAFERVKLNLLAGVTVDDVRRFAGKVQNSLKSEIPIAVVDKLGDCDCAIDVAKPANERRFVKIEKYLKEGFFPVGTPITWPLGINANNELLKVKVLDPNYIHPLVGGGTGSGKSVMLLSWIRWLLQWQPADVQIVLVDPKQVTFGQFENLNRIGNIAETMGLATEKAEELFPDKAQADAFADRMAPWLPFGIVKDPTEAVKTYERMCDEMARRYREFARWGVSNLEEYNSLMLRMNRPSMPVWVVITDEYYMQVSDDKIKKPTEAALARLGAMARACGIVMVISTQRPSYDILAVKVRDNCMLRCCLRVKGRNPAGVILGLVDDPDQAAIADGLAGKGDAIVEYDNRYERVQSLFWDGETLPPKPTVFPAPLDEDVSVEECQAAVSKPITPPVSPKEPTPAPVPEPQVKPSEPSAEEKQRVAIQELYKIYRQARESGQSVHKFIEETLGRKSYTPEWKRKFYMGLMPLLKKWILELHQQRDSDGNLLYFPEQIVSIVFGDNLESRSTDLYNEYCQVVESVIRMNSETGDVW